MAQIWSEISAKVAQISCAVNRHPRCGGDHIRGLLFDLDEGADVERVALNDTYQLGVVVLYNSLRDEPAAAAVASNAAEELERLFAEAFETQTGQWQGICLTYCDPMSDNAITVAQAEMLKEWRLEHMSRACQKFCVRGITCQQGA